MAKVSYNLSHMWNHAIGAGWKDKVTLQTAIDLFKRMWPAIPGQMAQVQYGNRKYINHE